MKAINNPIVAVALAGLLLAAAASAAAPEEGWRLRVNGYWLDANEGRISPLNTEYRSRVENAAALGGGIAGEYRFGPRLGVELGLLGGADNDYTVIFDEGLLAANDTLAFSAACAGLNVHLTPGKKVDFYAGPLVAYVTYSDMSLGVAPAAVGSPALLAPLSVNLDSELALGASLGVDVQIKQSDWLFNVGMKYLAASPDTTLDLRGVVFCQPEVLCIDAGPHRGRAAMDPLMVGVGFGYRF